MSTSFVSRKSQEKQYFKKILDFFEKHNLKYEDVSENPNFFSKDIDIILFTNDKKISIEVKIDSWLGKTGNFFLEIISNEERVTPGCFLKSEADVWLYVDSENDILYFFPLKKVRKWFFGIRKNLEGLRKYQEFEKTFKLQATCTESERGVFSHTTIGRLVSKKYFLGGLKLSNIWYKETPLDGNISLGQIEEITE